MSIQPIAVGYVRVSTKKDEQACSPDTQRMLIEGECQRQGWQLERCFEDRQSGWRGSSARPDYRELKAYLATTRVDYVVVADMSRLGRDLMEYMQLSREVLEPLGVELYLVRGVNGPGEQVELVRIIDAWLAEHYSRDLSRRTRDGMERLARGGGWGSVIPYGYRSSKRGADGRPDEPCVLWVHDDHALVVREMYSLAAAGESARAIARRFNARGIPSPKGSQWHTATVGRILSNRVYLGEVWHNGELMDKGHEPLVDAALWDSVRARRVRHKAQRARHPGDWLLPRVSTSHFIRRRADGPPLKVLFYGERRPSGRRVYRMETAARSRVYVVEEADELAPLLPAVVDAGALEHAVLSSLTRLAEDGAPAFWAEISAGDYATHRLRIERIKVELGQLRAAAREEQKRLDQALGFGLRERSLEYAARLDGIEGQISRAAAELAELREQPCEPPQGGVMTPRGLAERVEILGVLWRKGARAEVRKFLSAIIDHIDLRTDGASLLVHPYLHDLPELHAAAPGCNDTAREHIAQIHPCYYTILLPLGTSAQRRWLEQQAG